MLLTRARYEALHTGPVVLTGDFNSPPTGTDAGAYEIVTGSLPPVPINATFAAQYAVPSDKLSNFVLKDLKAENPRFAVSGNYATYTGFVAPGDSTFYTRIDFVFGGSNGGW